MPNSLLDYMKSGIEKAYSDFQAGHYESALKQYLTYANEGNAECQVFVGWLYERGIGIPRDQLTAGNWFKRAAENGSPQGAFYYARYILRYGDKKEAIPWFQKGANLGDVPSLFRLGYAYFHGVGVDSDHNKGIQLIQQAAGLGHIYALRELSLIEMRGYKGFTGRILGSMRLIRATLSAYRVARKDPYSERLRV